MNNSGINGSYIISTTGRLSAPAGEIWDVLADFSAVDTWAPQVTQSYQLGDKHTGVGAQRHCDIAGFGSIDEIITEWIDGKSLTYEVTPLGPLGVSYNRWSVMPLSDSESLVVVELSYDVRFGLFGKLLHALMMRGKLEEAFPKGLGALKERVESKALVRTRRAPLGQPQLAVSN